MTLRQLESVLEFSRRNKHGCRVIIFFGVLGQNCNCFWGAEAARRLKPSVVWCILSVPDRCSFSSHPREWIEQEEPLDCDFEFMLRYSIEGFVDF